MGKYNEKLIEIKYLINKNAPKILLPHQFYYPQLSTVKDRVTNEKKKNFLEYLSQIEPVKKEIMIYIHIPFCDSHCTFCSFDKAYKLEETNKYISEIIEEIKFYSQFNYLKKAIVASIHFGGGTPTILESHQIDKILKELYANFEIKTNCTINIEGSVTTLYKKEILDFIIHNNISRVSVGVQSFDEKIRKFYEAHASIDEVWKTLDSLKEKNIITYVDIMYGYPIFEDRYSDYHRVLKDVQKAIDLTVDGIEFGQLYPFYNQMQKTIKENKLRFSSKKQLVSLILDASQLMQEQGYLQQTEYAFIKSKGEIILEKAYYGDNGTNTDCLALGSSAFGSLNGWKYRNVFYRNYLDNKEDKYLQIKQLNAHEKMMSGIIGFPKTLAIGKGVLQRVQNNQEFLSTFEYLLKDEILEEKDEIYRLTQYGKCYIDNVYMALLSKEERKNILDAVKIHIIE